MPASASPTARYAPPRLRPATMRSGSRGFGVRASRTTNRTSRAARAASKPMTGAGVQRRERALGRARCDEDPEVRRRAAGDRREGKAREADHERTLAAHVVGDAAAQQEQTAEGQRVGGDDPLPVGVRCAERGLSRGQRDADDGRVEGDHQLRQGDERQSHPAPAGRLGRRPNLFCWRRGHTDATSRRRTRLAAPPRSAPPTTTIAATPPFGLTVMSKSTPRALPTLTPPDNLTAVLPTS